MRIRRLLASVFALSILLSVFFVPANATPSATAKGDTISAVPGKTVDFGVSISGNPGISGFRIKLTYDKSVFTLETNQEGEPNCTRGDFSSAGTILCSETAKGCQVMWYHVSDCQADGSLFSLRFQVSDDAVSGDYPIEISYVAADTINSSDERVPLTCVCGKIQVHTFAPTLLGESASCRLEDELDYTVSIQDNPGLSGYKVYLSYDDAVFTPITDETTSDLLIVRDEAFSSGNAVGKKLKGGLWVLWYDTSDIKQDGKLFTVRFKVGPSAAVGSYPITVGYIQEDTLNADEQPVSFTCVNGNVSVSANYAHGDVNGDGYILVTDMECLYTYLSTGVNEGQISNISVFYQIADVNGDGAVNILDYQALYEMIRQE